MVSTSFLRPIPAGLCLSVCCLAAHPAFAVTHRRVVFTGDYAPGYDTTIFTTEFFGEFDTFSAPLINQAGQVVFEGAVKQDYVNGENWQQGIWTDLSGGIDLVMRLGHTLPHPDEPAPVVANGYVDAEHISDTGVITFHSGIEDAYYGAFNSNYGKWRWDQGVSTPLLAQNQPISSDDGDNDLRTFSDASYNRSGRIVFPADTSDQEGIWLESAAGGLDYVMLDRAPTPGLNAVFFPNTQYALLEPVINDHGTTAFLTRVAGEGLGPLPESVWVGEAGAMQLLALEGAPAPTPTGVAFWDQVFNNLSFPTINNAGHIAFTAGHGRTAQTAGGSGLMSTVGGALEWIIMRDSPATQAGPGMTFHSFDASSLALNANSDLAFIAELDPNDGVSDPSDHGSLWIESSGGSRRLVVQAGESAPGVDDPGVVFARLYSGMFFNAAGSLVFAADLAGPGVTPGLNERGLWVADPDGGIRLILRFGDQMDADDDPAVEDMRTVAGFFYQTNPFFSTGGQDGRPYAFNDAGQLAMTVRFTDGDQGVYVFDLNATSSLPADLSGDGDVDDEDLGLFFSNFTGPGLGPPPNPAADLSGDGDVDDEDLGLVFSAFTGPLAPINVPEPATLLPFALSMLVVRRRRA